MEHKKCNSYYRHTHWHQVASWEKQANRPLQLSATLTPWRDLVYGLPTEMQLVWDTWPPQQNGRYAKVTKAFLISAWVSSLFKKV